MAKKYETLANSIVELLGGKDNVQFFTHCVTRLRFNVKDQSVVKQDEINKIDGVLGSQWQNGQFQIIIGQTVADAYKLVCEKNDFNMEKVASVNDEVKPEGKKGVKGVIDKVFDGISGSLTPVIPALIGCGMIKVILIFLDMAGIDSASGFYQLLTYAGDAGFYFLPIIIGSSSAKKFGATPVLGMVVGGMLVYPSFLTNSGLDFFGITVPAVGYASTIFPIILSCAVMAPIEKFFAKNSPAILRSVLQPLCTILIMIPLAYCVLGPAGSYLGTYLSSFVLFIYNTIGFVGVALLAAFMPFIIMTGMHGAFVPYLMQMLTVSPLYEPIFFPALIISNINQGVSALAVALKSKDTSLKSTGLSTSVTAILAGVTEPAMYAINMKYKTPMYGAMIGSAIGGCVAGLLGTAIYAFAGASSVIALPLFISGDKPNNFMFMIISVLVGVVATFVATWVLYKEEVK